MNKRSKNERKKTNIVNGFYEITMSYGYFNDHKHEAVLLFLMCFIAHPDQGGMQYCRIRNGCEYVENLTFTASEIAYLESKNIFKEFLDYLKHLNLLLTYMQCVKERLYSP